MRWRNSGSQSRSLPPLPPTAEWAGGALLAVLNAAGDLLAYGAYAGAWLLRDGFCNADPIVVAGITDGGGSTIVLVDVASRTVISIGENRYPVRYRKGAPFRYEAGDVVVHVHPVAAYPDPVAELALTVAGALVEVGP